MIVFVNFLIAAGLIISNVENTSDDSSLLNKVKMPAIANPRSGRRQMINNELSLNFGLVNKLRAYWNMAKRLMRQLINELGLSENYH